jgi:hypothetical protein
MLNMNARAIGIRSAIGLRSGARIADDPIALRNATNVGSFGFAFRSAFTVAVEPGRWHAAPGRPHWTVTPLHMLHWRRRPVAAPAGLRPGASDGTENWQTDGERSAKRN